MPITDPDDTGEDAGVPRWVKVSGAAVALLLVVLAIVALAGGGHGPGRHSLSAEIATGDMQARR